MQGDMRVKSLQGNFKELFDETIIVLTPTPLEWNRKIEMVLK